MPRFPVSVSFQAYHSDPAVPYVMPKDLPLGQRLALAIMRRTDIARLVQHALREIESPVPRLSDFAPLVADDLATRDGQWHRLTEQGVTAADEVIEAFARQLGIHFKIVSGESRFQHSMRCTCGRTFSHSRNEGHWGMAQLRLWSKHLTEIEDAKAKGETYLPPELRVLKIIEAAFTPPTSPE